MSEDDFRAIALAITGAVERSHMAHPDFRVGDKGRVFATLNSDDDGDYGVVMLTPEEQAEFVAASPGVFEPLKGKWGERGATRVNLKRAGKRVVARAMEAAWKGKIAATSAGRRR
ncbi:MAG TPA: MmcQ/YjbR family DNA-binding protein [Phycisphaerales bacterium]|nr:MmcQ/YjbR family DNA-binding protein [Phycisphaerales bacterium]